MRFVTCLLFSALLGCTGSIGDKEPVSDVSAGPGSGGGSTGEPGTGSPQNWSPVVSCEPSLPVKVTRLSDRHLAHALRDLLGLSEPPKLSTSSSSAEQFLPNKAAAVDGAVATKLRDLAEKLSIEVTKPDHPYAGCAGEEASCAAAFIRDFGARVFRRPLTDAEASELLNVYGAGKLGYGGHVGGIRLALEALLQSPSFLYQTELGAAPSQPQLTQPELAAKLSFFLRDGLPDASLREAVAAGQLGTNEQILQQVDRLLATSEVKENVSKIFVRLFDLERLKLTNKAQTISEFTPELVDSMAEETRRFIDATLWQRGAKLSELFTSRETFVDARLAGIYGIPAPAASGFSPVSLDASQRAGILTQPSLMTMEALPDESSVIHRGVFVVRELLCFHPPPPTADLVAIGEQLKEQEPTERGRAERRAEMPVCAACHANFDPFGVAFEHYDTLGRYRNTIQNARGQFPIDASWDYKLYDIQTKVDGALELSQHLAKSGAVRECMTRQLASYALGQRLTDAQACSIGDLAQKLTASGGNLLELIREVAAWPGLRQRSQENLP